MSHLGAGVCLGTHTPVGKKQMALCTQRMREEGNKAFREELMNSTFCYMDLCLDISSIVYFSIYTVLNFCKYPGAYMQIM
jgi:hypothetical protein